MTRLQLNDNTLPGLFQSADSASIEAQARYFFWLRLYLLLLIAAAGVSFAMSEGRVGAIASASLFLITLFILVGLRISRPDDVWYNGRAVAESVKTRAWRWCMRAEPYEQVNDPDGAIANFVDDLKNILDQNKSLSGKLLPEASRNQPISDEMKAVRELPLMERMQIYKVQRVDNQAAWYSKKARFSREKGQQWFGVSIVLHAGAILLLLLRVASPGREVPTDAIATAAGAVLTWLEAKKYNELESSYALAANEIDYVRAKAALVKTEPQFSEFVLSSEAAFSREHTQWVARRAD